MYALVLAGGRGERLRPITDTRPKPMVEVCGKPILDYQVRWLRHFGVTDVVFLVSYKWEVVNAHFGDGGAYGLRCHYSVEESPLGRGGGIRQGLGMVPRSEPLVLATNGDVVSDLDLGDMLRRHRETGALATDLLVPFTSPYGVARLTKAGMIAGFREKPVLPYWINGGVYVLDRSLEERFPQKGDHEDTTFPELAREGRLAGYTSRAPWKSVDSFKDMREAEPIAVQLEKRLTGRSAG